MSADPNSSDVLMFSGGGKLQLKCWRSFEVKQGTNWWIQLSTSNRDKLRQQLNENVSSLVLIRGAQCRYSVQNYGVKRFSDALD